jgi:chlorobactene glucosyltransferase
MIARRDAYESVGGHEVARGYCATDVMLARGMFRNGSHVMMTHGGSHASIRMYTSLGELVAGWSKNIVMGTGMSANNLELRDKLKNVVLLMIPLYQLLPVVALITGLIVGVPVLIAAGAACAAVVTALWIFIYRVSGVPLQHSLMFAAGASVLAYILATSMARGKRFSWRGREYVSR